MQPFQFNCKNNNNVSKYWWPLVLSINQKNVVAKNVIGLIL